MVWDPSTAQRIQQRVIEFVDSRAHMLETVSGETLPLVEFARRFLAGGKKFRAQFCVLGWSAIPQENNDNPPSGAPEHLTDVAGAFEIFHAAALIHDDIIDNSDTRRGAPSAHKEFESMHTAARYAGSAAEFGRKAALLLGDLLLGWSDELLDEGLASIDPARARAVRRDFNTMRTQVTAGQYLDVLEESAWVAHTDDALASRSERIITYKSAKYSVEAPLSIGALVAGASAEQLHALRSFGLPLGIAFQLRDDLLGVFGNPAVTGKPSGDDLREGKRTMLVAIARDRASAKEKELLDELIGDPTLTREQIADLQALITKLGAVAEMENRIHDQVACALSHLETTLLKADTIAELRATAHAVATRST